MGSGGNLTATIEPLAEEAALKVFDASLVPDDPPAEIWYRHKPNLLKSVRELFRRGEIIYTLAERDIKAQYKQAVLGVSWALLLPLVNLVVLTILVGHTKGFSIGGGVPIVLSMYVGLLVWGFFGGAIGGGASSLVGNKMLMAKSHFPRECFPMAQILESAFTSLMAVAPLFVLFGITGYGPKLTSLWSPLYLAIEIPFSLGFVLFVSAIIVQARDLQQVIPVVLPLAMIVTVLKPLTQVSHHVLHPVFILGWQRIAYCIVNPMAPIMTVSRDSILIGIGPQWGLLGWALLGSLAYLVLGYKVFKRLEVNFADLT